MSLGSSSERTGVSANALMALGWNTLRFTWEDLIDDPQYVIDQVRAYTG